MKATEKIETAAATGGIAGIAILLLTTAHGIGGAILGAAITAATAAAIADNHLKQLRETASQFNEKRQQYEAAYATLTSQRQRIRIEFEGRLAEHTARLNAAHQANIFEARQECYWQGAIDAISGRLAQYEPPADTNVIPLHHHRAAPSLGHTHH